MIFEASGVRDLVGVTTADDPECVTGRVPIHDARQSEWRHPLDFFRGTWVWPVIPNRCLSVTRQVGLARQELEGARISLGLGLKEYAEDGQAPHTGDG